MTVRLAVPTQTASPTAWLPGAEVRSAVAVYGTVRRVLRVVGSGTLRRVKLRGMRDTTE